jgi:hypothetical protein
MTDVANVGVALGAKHGVHGGPHYCCRLADNELTSGVRLHGAGKKAKNLLVHDPSAGLRRVVNLHSGIYFSLGECLRRGRTRCHQGSHEGRHQRD